MTLTSATPVAALRALLDARYSCRGYRPDPVPVQVVREILETAQRAPSWCNTQPWHAVVMAGQETDRFREHLLAKARQGTGVSDIEAPQRYENVYRDRRRASGFALYDSLGIAYDDKDGRNRQMLENFRFFGAPHVAIITSEAALGPYGYVDCGIYVANFLLAATNLGVATIAQAAIAMYSDVVREYLNIPDTRHIVCAISFGYADPDHPANTFRTERATLGEAAELRGF
jgi:nitroreductase